MQTLLAALALAAVSVEPRPPQLGLADLTLPASRLPTGCVVTQTPWVGADPPRIASIRERLDPVTIVDAVPLSRGEMARFRIQFAEGIAEAYQASYR